MVGSGILSIGVVVYFKVKRKGFSSVFGFSHTLIGCFLED